MDVGKTERACYVPKGKLFKSSEIRKRMERTSDNCKMRIEKIRRERDSWKETALVVGDVARLPYS